MKNRNIMFGLIFLSLILFGLNFAAAQTYTVTINKPAAGETMRNSASGNVTLNISLVDAIGNKTRGEFINISIFLKSTSTANSTDGIGNLVPFHIFSWNGTMWGKTINTTELVALGNGTYINISVAGFEDSNDYTLLANVTNRTGNQGLMGSDTNLNMIIDNGVPTAPSSLTNGAIKNLSISLFSTVVGRDTTSCLLIFTKSVPGANKIVSMTHSGNSCSTSSLTFAEGIYYYIVQANDGNNQTNSSEVNVNIDVEEGTHGGGLTEQQLADIEDESTKGKGVIIFIVVIILVVLIVRKLSK